jgi:hypothetical protein
VWRIGSILLLAGAGAMFLTQLSALRRYVRMRRMSGDGHPTPPGTLPEAADVAPRWGTSHWPLH